MEDRCQDENQAQEQARGDAGGFNFEAGKAGKTTQKPVSVSLLHNLTTETYAYLAFSA